MKKEEIRNYILYGKIFIILFGVIFLELFIKGTMASEEMKLLIEAEHPYRQYGSQGNDYKSAASCGEVLGCEFGRNPGHFAEYEFDIKETLTPANIAVRYARALSGSGLLNVSIDGKFVGKIKYVQTGGWGNAESDFRWTSLTIPKLDKGSHLLRLTVLNPRLKITFPEIATVRAPILDIIGNRPDKNCVGHGKNVALYTGQPSKSYFATYKLGDIFSAVDGATIKWYPDYVLVTPDIDYGINTNVNLDQIVISKSELNVVHSNEKIAKSKLIEQRQVCVTKDDVVVSVIYFTNPTNKIITHKIEITGDCRASRDWRGKSGGKKITKRKDNFVVMIDKNVFPTILADGLCMAVGSSIEPEKIATVPAGTYNITYEVKISAKSTRRLTFACAIHPDLEIAEKNLVKVLKQDDPIALNRKEWQDFFANTVPSFSCSDKGLEELYDFRWFLLKFSTAGGNLGYFKYPVVLEGRQAYQTYCCYSAPFMALDMNWAVNSQVGFGQIANMTNAAYEDGRFPWYTSPCTNHVKIHHQSKTGLSLLPYAAWKHYLIHGNKEMLRKVYPVMKKNVEWWIANRDADGDGLFTIANQLETGMDDLFRWGEESDTLQYDAVDATSYAYANLMAVANMSRVLSKKADTKYFEDYADKTKRAANSLFWDARDKSWRDRNPKTGQLSNILCITTFYPFFAGIGEHQHLGVFRKHLLNPEQFWLAHPVPALSKDDPSFNPTAFWQGPSWPAATSHVIEAFATSAKALDSSLLPYAAELIKRAVKNHLQPRVDFYERYNPLTGEPLSHFRDYMHSWWIDIIIRDVVGFEPREDGLMEIEPLPMGLDYFLLKNVNYQGKNIIIVWQSPDKPKKYENYPLGYSVFVDGKLVHNDTKIRKWIEKK